MRSKSQCLNLSGWFVYAYLVLTGHRYKRQLHVFVLREQGSQALLFVVAFHPIEQALHGNLTQRRLMEGVEFSGGGGLRCLKDLISCRVFCFF